MPNIPVLKLKSHLVLVCFAIIETTLRSAIPNLFGTRDWFLERQFFPQTGVGEGETGGGAQAVMRVVPTDRWGGQRSGTPDLHASRV